MPGDLFAAGQQPVLERQGVHEPLPAGDDLERSVALLVELHDVLHRLRFAHQVTGIAQQIRDPGARLLGVQARELAHGGVGGFRVAGLPAGLAERAAADRAVLLHHDAGRQAELASTT